MKFKMPEILYQKYFVKEMDSCLILMDTEDSLLMVDKNFLDDSVGRNIKYQKISENRLQRKEILADFSGDYYFQVQEQLFEVLNEKYGFVESERSLSIFSYRLGSIDFTSDFISKDKFLVLEKMRQLQKPDLEKVQAYFREAGEYGVDRVFDESLKHYFLSSSQTFMDVNKLLEDEPEKNDVRK